ncbi:MAG: phosphotransferase, partial [Sciscionella sp.]
ALVLSSALSSAVGFLFWVIAAREYDEKVVGSNSALVYAIMFLAGIAQLNLPNVLLRFVPVAAAGTRRFVLLSYLVGGGLAAAAGLTFAIGVRWWSPNLVSVLGGSRATILFALACGVWSVFVMQDSVLTAVGRAPVVTLENFLFSLLKLSLILLFTSILPITGIVVSWMVATAIVVVLTNLYLFARAVPDQLRRPADSSHRVPAAGVVRYLAGDYVGMLCWLGCTQMLPVLVLGYTGARSTATFTIAWTIAYALYLVPMGMGQALVAHTSADLHRLHAARQGVARRSLIVLVPVVAVLLVVAPYALRLLGSDYASAGTPVLRLAALSAIPSVIVTTAVSEARVRRRMVTVVAILAAVSALVITLSVLLMPLMGVIGVGVALLAAQTTVATAVLLTRAGWFPRSIANPMARLAGVLLIRRVAPALFARLARSDGARWRIQRILGGYDGRASALVGPESGQLLFLEAASSVRGRVQLERQLLTLTALHADQRLAGLHELFPRALAAGECADAYYLLHSRVSGTAAGARCTVTEGLPVFVGAALHTLSDIHRRAGHTVTADDSIVDRFVYRPASNVRAAVAGQDANRLDRLARALDAGLRGKAVAIGWAHGDFVGGNILTDDAGQLSGLVDWRHAEPDGAILVDAATLLLATETESSGRELGEVVLAFVADCPVEVAQTLRDMQRELPAEVVDARTALLLGWLHMVSHNLLTSRRYATNPVWTRRNVRNVVRALGPQHRGAVAPPSGRS